MEWRSGAEFERMGQLTGEEFSALLELSRTSKVKFGIAGGLAETFIGISRRMDPTQKHLFLLAKAEWRLKYGVSRLRDVDVWFEMGTSAKEMREVQDGIRRIFRNKPLDIDGYSLNYPLEEHLEKAGAIVFENGATRRYLAPWQRLGW
jgi:hypothetical protein